MQIEKKKISALNMAAYNPRIQLQPGDDDYESIKYSIETYGMLEPIIWNKQTNNVVSGHQRLNILQAQGQKEVEVSVIDLDQIAEKQLNVALNKVSGRWDEEKLEQLLDELGEDAKKTGFTQEEIDSLKKSATYFEDQQPEEKSDIDETEFFCMTVTFNNSDKKQLKSYIKQNGDSKIVDTIVAVAKNGI